MRRHLGLSAALALAIAAAAVVAPFAGASPARAATCASSVDAGSSTVQDDLTPTAGCCVAGTKYSITNLTQSNSTSSTNTYSRKITTGKFGNVQHVSYGKKVNFRKHRLNADCTTTTLTSNGSITYPSRVEGWYYWETSS